MASTARNLILEEEERHERGHNKDEPQGDNNDLLEQVHTSVSLLMRSSTGGWVEKSLLIAPHKPPRG